MGQIELIISASAQDAIRDAIHIAWDSGLVSVTPEHLLIAILKGNRSAALAIIKTLTQTVDAFVRDISPEGIDIIRSESPSGVHHTKELKDLTRYAITYALQTKTSYVGTQHYLLALATPFVGMPDLFARQGITLDAIASLVWNSGDLNERKITNEAVLAEIVVRPGSLNHLLIIEKDEKNWRFVKQSMKYLTVT